LGIPAVTIAATSFLSLVEKTGLAEGIPNLRYAEYPGPISLDSISTINKYFQDKTINEIIEELTSPLGRKDISSKKAGPREIIFRGTLQEVNNYFSANWWTDGLAIIPPTIDRVEEFLACTPLSPEEEVAVLRPAGARVTPWNIAVQGVMAGCRPEHMPVLVAAVEAMGDPFYNLEQLGSTGGWNMFFVVNGPICKALGIENGVALVSRGANPVIGRALGLVRHNLAGQRPGEVYMGTFGYILPPVFAENEDILSDIGWKPYHVDEGFHPFVSTVTIGGTAKWGYQMYPVGNNLEAIAQLLAYDVARSGSPNHSVGQQESPRLVFTIFITPGLAKAFAEGGYTKELVKEAIWKNARYTIKEVDFESYFGSHEGQQETHKDFIRKGKLPSQVIEKGKMPIWFPKVIEEEDMTIPVMPRSRQIIIFVCGDPSRNKSMTFYTMYNAPVTKVIKLPPDWPARLKDLTCDRECKISY